MIAWLRAWLGISRACTCLMWERTYPCMRRYGKFDCRKVFLSRYGR